MFLQNSQTQQIEKSLDRLKIQSTYLPAQQLISPLYYCSHLLYQYAHHSPPTEANHLYFAQLKKELEMFSRKDLSKLKLHHRQIVQDIIHLVNSQSFIKCERPQLATIRSETIASDEEWELSIEVDQFQSIIIPQSICKNNITTNTLNQINMRENVAELASTESSDNLLHQEQQKLYAQLVCAYQQHRIDQAHDLKNKYENKKFTMNNQREKLFKTIELEYGTMVSFYKQFDQEGWIFDKEENGITLQYIVFEDKQVAVRVTGEFDVPIDHFLAILTEIDLFQTFVPFCYGSRQLKIISRNQKIGTSKVFIPCLTDRQTYFYAAGYDRVKKNGSIFLYSKTINQDKIYQDKYQFSVPEQSEYVRLEYKFYIIQYIPIGRQKAKVRLACKVDMKLNYLPQIIINMSARKFAFDYFKNIAKLNKKFKGSDWEKRIRENQDFYGFFRRKTNEYLGQKQK